MIGLRSAQAVPPTVLSIAQFLTTLLLAAAMFGLGAAVRMSSVLRSGPRALLLGLLSTVLVRSVAIGALTVLR